MQLFDLLTALDLPMLSDNAANGFIRGVCAINSPNEEAGLLSFLMKASDASWLENTSATWVFVPESMANPANVIQTQATLLYCKNPQLMFARALTLLFPEVNQATVHPSAQLSPSAQLGQNVQIGANVVIGDNVQIGDNVVLGAGCVIEAGSHIGANSHLCANVTLNKNTQIGKNALLQSGVVLGGRGFGFARDGVKWVAVPQIGRVILGDDVEIGANTSIDRGALGDTVLGDGVKIDNLVQIAHNVQIGAHTAIAAQVGVAGSTKIGARCIIAGQVGIADHIEIVDDVVITGMSMVTRSIKKAGLYSSGWPAEPAMEWRKRLARLRRMSEK